MKRSSGDLPNTHDDPSFFSSFFCFFNLLGVLSNETTGKIRSTRDNKSTSVIVHGSAEGELIRKEKEIIYKF